MDSKKNNLVAVRGWKYVGLGVAGLLCGGFLHAAETLKFSNSSAITIPTGNGGPASPYPSVISTFFPKGKISSVSVTLNKLSHTYMDNIDILLVGPSGVSVLLMSDAGASFPVANANLTFADGAPLLPNATQIASGTYSPTNYGSPDIFVSPSPASASATLLSAFKGLKPTSTWSLYVFDDSDDNGGSIAGGWSLQMVVDQPPVPNIKGGDTIAVTKQKVLIKGTAKDDLTEVAQVFVKVNNGPLKLADGRKKWRYEAKLKLGTNKIRVYAVDTEGNLSSATTQRIVRLPSGAIL